MRMHTGLGHTLGSLSWTCMIIVILLPGYACAALGGDMASVDADQAAMNASERITASSESYTVYELRVSTGTSVREYLSLDGKVFAVGWKGPLLPDLRLILGDYFKLYAESSPDQQGGHGHRRINRPDLVVESNGRMRAFFGHAYLPQAMPPDVAVSDIR